MAIPLALDDGGFAPLGFCPGPCPGRSGETQVWIYSAFSTSRAAKEFFLVASFSSASFPLTVESVGIALQCCTGGYRVGLNVVQISPHAFRFSVANNKVGHFIYSLKDRVWPDFVCHFHLFNGRFNRAPVAASYWHADEELLDISKRNPIMIKTHLC